MKRNRNAVPKISASSVQNDSTIDTTANPNETLEKLIKPCFVLLERTPLPSADNVDVPPSKENHFRFDASDQIIFEVISQKQHGKLRHFAEKGWADKLHQFMREQLPYDCTWSFKRPRVRTSDIECEGIYDKYICTTSDSCSCSMVNAIIKIIQVGVRT